MKLTAEQLNKIKEAIENGNKNYWADVKIQTFNYNEYKKDNIKKEDINVMQGNIIDYIYKEVIKTLRDL